MLRIRCTTHCWKSNVFPSSITTLTPMRGKGFLSAVFEPISHAIAHLELTLLPCTLLPLLPSSQSGVVSLDVYPVKHFMVPHVVCLSEQSTVADIQSALRTSHGGFPVVTREGDKQLLKGFIVRAVSTQCLCLGPCVLTGRHLTAPEHTAPSGRRSRSF